MSRSRTASRDGAGTTQVRICVVGDALVSGVGDPKALGWVGRVAARHSCW